MTRQEHTLGKMASVAVLFSAATLIASSSSSLPTRPAFPALTLSPSSGTSGQAFTITGSGFFANYSGGVVWFDSDNTSHEPQNEHSPEPWKNVNTDATGAFTTSLVVPTTPGDPGLNDPLGAHTYVVRAQLPIGGSADASALFTVTSPNATLTVTPTSAKKIGQVMEISGRYFPTSVPPNSPISGKAWVDTNNSGGIDGNEQSKAFEIDKYGKFTATLAVPSPGTSGARYTVRAEVPLTSGQPVKASAEFSCFGCLPVFKRQLFQFPTNPPNR